MKRQSVTFNMEHFILKAFWWICNRCIWCSSLIKCYLFFFLSHLRFCSFYVAAAQGASRLTAVSSTCFFFVFRTMTLCWSASRTIWGYCLFHFPSTLWNPGLNFRGTSAHLLHFKLTSIQNFWVSWVHFFERLVTWSNGLQHHSQHYFPSVTILFYSSPLISGQWLQPSILVHPVFCAGRVIKDSSFIASSIQSVLNY